MYYKLRCNSTQFVIYYKLRNYYKLQRNMALYQLLLQSDFKTKPRCSLNLLLLLIHVYIVD